MYMIELFSGGILTMCLILWLFIRKQSKQAKNAIVRAERLLEETLTMQPGFKATQRYAAMDGKTGIAADGQRVALLHGLQADRPHQVQVNLFDQGQLLAVEIIEDGVTVARAARNAQEITEAFEGEMPTLRGVLVNPVTDGTSDLVRSIELRVVVADRTAPVRVVPFCSSSDVSGDKLRNSKAYKDVRDSVDVWYASLTRIMEQGKKNISA